MLWDVRIVGGDVSGSVGSSTYKFHPFLLGFAWVAGYFCGGRICFVWFERGIGANIIKSTYFSNNNPPVVG